MGLLRTALPWSFSDDLQADLKLCLRRVYCLRSKQMWDIRSPSGSAFQPTGTKRRPLIVHYHLFKNAGSSVDAILRANFANRWRGAEFAPEWATQLLELDEILAKDNELIAISSHTLSFPPSRIPGAQVLPIVFLRHPLDRQKSAYNFERTQRADTLGARVAKDRDFAGYIRTRLGDPEDRGCRDFQAWRLAMMEPTGEGTELERALRVIDTLPFVGLVEAFEQSIVALERLLRPLFPAFRGFVVRENVTHPAGQTLDERLRGIASALGPDLLRAFETANGGDFELYRRLCQHYGAAR